MTSLRVLVITWVWWAIIVELVVVKPSIITKETTSLGYNTVSFNLEDATEQVYRSFIQSLRNELKTSTPVCQIPVTPQSITENKRFVVVNLIRTSSKEVQLGIDVTNVYVVGYQDKWNNQDRAVFIKDAPALAKDKLFPGARNKVTLPFGGSYLDLQRAGNVNRGGFPLGVDKLGYAIDSIYGKPINNRDVARFLLIAIQMVSEAARFKYIENEVVDRGLNYGSFTPNPKMLSLENNWGHISDAIHNSNECKTISPALRLKNADDSPWVVGEVSQIRPDLGILKFKSSKLTQFNTIIKSLVVEGSDELEILEPIG